MTGVMTPKGPDCVTGSSPVTHPTASPGTSVPGLAAYRRDSRPAALQRVTDPRARGRRPPTASIGSPSPAEPAPTASGSVAHRSPRRRGRASQRRVDLRERADRGPEVARVQCGKVSDEATREDAVARTYERGPGGGQAH